MLYFITHKSGNLYRVKLGEAVEAPQKNYEKSEIIKKIESGDSFFVKDTQVHILKINGNKYLRTDRNNIEEDNIGNLEEIPDALL